MIQQVDYDEVLRYLFYVLKFDCLIAVGTNLLAINYMVQAFLAKCVSTAKDKRCMNSFIESVHAHCALNDV
jgi:hypothetical protein